MLAYLTIASGARAGVQVPLEEEQENRIGRGLECQVVLADPLSSRVHAVIVCEGGVWRLRNAANSRNGTFLDGQRIDEARLFEGCRFAIGASQFVFHEGDAPLDATQGDPSNLTQTIVCDTPVDAADTGRFAVSALQDPERAQDLLMLYQLSIKLLGCHDPDEVIRVALDLLLERAKASVAGFLWVSDDGRLKPKLVIPEGAAEKVRLSESLTKIVCEQGRAVWIANQSSESPAKSMRHFADALCAASDSPESNPGRNPSLSRTRPLPPERF